MGIAICLYKPVSQYLNTKSAHARIEYSCIHVLNLVSNLLDLAYSNRTNRIYPGTAKFSILKSKFSTYYHGSRCAQDMALKSMISCVYSELHVLEYYYARVYRITAVHTTMVLYHSETL
jgi:hypothetical protein